MKAATTGVDGNKDNDNNNADAPTSTSPHPLPLFPGAPLPVIVRGALATLERETLLNKLIITFDNKQTKCVFLFHQGTEQPHQGNMNTRVAIPNTSEEV